MSKKRRLKGFGKFLCIYAGVLLAVIVVMLFLLHGFLRDYEQGRPASTMDKIVSQFTVDNIQNLLDESGVTFNEFENNQVVGDYLKDKISDNEVTYKKFHKEYSETNPVYMVYAGDTAIAKVKLDENGKNAHKFTKWKLGSITFDGCTDKNNNTTVTIKAPKGSTVKINGVTVNDSYITQNDVAFDPCKYVSSYVTAPALTVYTIDGLVVQPDITAQLGGTDLTVDTNKNTYLVNYPSDDALLAAQHSAIMTVAENYGKYMINRGSMSTLSAAMVGHAKENIADIPAVWAFLYGNSYTYEFRNESISNFRKYSDSCFSCNIYYDLYVDWSAGNKTYNTSLTYTFVKISGKWHVADFMIN
jgi:hypothetical protein